MSTDLHTLSGAYALHALSSEEAEEFQKHLAACAACRLEVAELQRAAAVMGASEALAPPAELRARVLAAADRTPPQPPRPTSAADLGRRRRITTILSAAAAVVVIVAGAVVLDQVQDEETPGGLLASGVVRVFEAEDANTATMETSNGGKISVATSPELNEMAIDTDELPVLDDEHVYQLWAIHDDVVESVTVLAPEKGASMEMPSSDTEVAITIEPAGGSEQPTTEPIMRAKPSEV